ncbi:MAG: hypothetical protein KBF21_07470 [Thermoanaerobaculia bacterium]|nr:hypothetical protein [Thermoanaerobaculia bacterium]MBP9824044.1 hypothetical protein [Thermoanaerobaculia bacterium]
MSVLRWQEPNLARNPFVNERPVRRLAITLWVLFVLVAGAGFWMSRTIRVETGTRVAELARLNAATLADRESAVRLEADLRGANLPAQNERAEFLNRRLAERSFSWNELLETLTGAMPRSVRLLRLNPEGFTRERGRAQAAAETPATTRVAMRILGEAEETEALLEFVDRLFAHPAFDRPNLSRESVKKDLKIQFDIAVDYLPQTAARTTVASTAEAAIADAAHASDAAGAAAGPDRPAAAATGAGLLPGLAGAPAGAPLPATVAGGRPEGAGKPATGRPLPSSQAAAAGARGGAGEEDVKKDPPREDLGGNSGKLEAVAGEARGGTDSSGAPRMGGLPAVAAPGFVGGSGGAAGSGARGGTAAPPAPAAGGSRFPENVMPTPLRPYASSIGGGR